MAVVSIFVVCDVGCCALAVIGVKCDQHPCTHPCGAPMFVMMVDYTGAAHVLY